MLPSFTQILKVSLTLSRQLLQVDVQDPAILGMMILKMMIAGTVMLDVCTDPRLRLQQPLQLGVQPVPYAPTALPQLEVYNLLGFLMNKQEHAPLVINLSLQMRAISLDDMMNQKSIGNMTTKRTHGIGAVMESFQIQGVAQ